MPSAGSIRARRPPDTIRAVRLEFLRNRGLGPASLKARVQDRLRRRRISRYRLGRFLDEMNLGPAVALPWEPPRTIAIVVPCFRHESYLPQMLESIARQTRRPDEVIFVDDNSPDGTATVLRAFVAGSPWSEAGRSLLLVNDRNIGQAASLNRAISAASSDLVMILNDDDYLMHDAVESMLAVFRDHPDVALAGTGHVGFAGSESLAAASKMSADHAAPDARFVVRNPAEVRTYKYAHELDMTHSGQCFRRSAWQAVGGYRSDKRDRVVPFSDRDFQIRVAAVWPVAIAPGRPLAFWRNDSSVDAGLHS
jgi:GT2 family glycosyltransferase